VGVSVEVMRLLRKIDSRDRKIAGLRRRVEQLETAIANHEINVRRMPIDVTRAVQEALCNVRMIPVLGVGSSARIVEIKASDA